MGTSFSAFKPSHLRNQDIEPDRVSNSSTHKQTSQNPLPRDDQQTKKTKKQKYRTIWISDMHLGTRGCKADYLLHFLKSTHCDTLYLVGDVIDGWHLRKGFFWSPNQTEVIRRILKIAKKGTKVYYIPGNHDEGLRDYLNIKLAGISVVGDAIHTTADNRKIYILHGDQFDSVVLYAKWLAFVGDRSYQLLLRTNTFVNKLRALFGMPYWSLSAAIKGRVKNAVEFMSRFEDAVCKAAAERGVHGVVCGHIHHAQIKQMGDITYYNDGDWVESCTALVEHFDGHMELLYWSQHYEPKQAMPEDDDIDAVDVGAEVAEAALVTSA
ncbi:MAG: UDP-2,3-diacylglucosamine diphosphatase [Pseudomonadota bacterium]